jgi:hypothetical protein
MSDSTALALEAIERVPEHELRRLLKRMAVTDPPPDLGNIGDRL